MNRPETSRLLIKPRPVNLDFSRSRQANFPLSLGHHRTQVAVRASKAPRGQASYWKTVYPFVRELSPEDVERAARCLVAQSRPLRAGGAGHDQGPINFAAGQAARAGLSVSAAVLALECSDPCCSMA